ncbi:GNAT family N-acetyltransferase [Solwaraspora sp. WMMB335]|uniref:GNAT family N-acetyltransferase n=1 Tax=Solwaraspora sp. WMMB335 TaxID=3404118 RepID=UPI003B956DC5
MLLRDVRLDDVDAYRRMRCDPVMMAELGGPLPVDGIAAKVERDVRAVAADVHWIKMIVPDPADPGTVAGSVALWPNDVDGTLESEIGWMVLPEFQRRGLAKQATRTMLELARDDGRWGRVHAHPAVTNAASNAVCRALGFTLLGETSVTFADRVLRSNRWMIDTARRPTQAEPAGAGFESGGAPEDVSGKLPGSG